MLIHKIPVVKAKLDVIPKRERVLFVLLGHFLDEISILNKLLLIANVQPEADLMRKAHTTQSLLIARMFIGKLLEGWQMLQRDFFSTVLSKHYEPKLQAPGDAALANLKRYFGKANLLQDIRNNFAFHYSSDQVKQQLATLEASYKSEIYLASDYANSLNWACGEIVSYAMLNTVGAVDPQQALNRIVDDLTKVGDWFFDFCGSCISIIIEQYFGTDLRELNAEEIDIGEPVSLEAITLPYFMRRATREAKGRPLTA
ncbi:MAG: hypothetical protein MN733_03120, partial [Nitrososphaera sp.]|nr:hypothetical protein [Nitrososphaera sp.]